MTLVRPDEDGAYTVDAAAMQLEEGLRKTPDLCGPVREAYRSRFLFVQGTQGTEEEQRIGSPSTYAPGAAVPPTLLVSAEPSAEEGSHGYIASRASQRYAELLLSAGHRASWSHHDDETHSSLVLDFGTPGDGPTGDVGAFIDGL